VVVSGALPAFPVTVEEDLWGIPHIRARSDADATFALGLLHAEERLWQMDINRRAGMGRLSEFFGARTLPTDRFLRTVGFEEAALSALAALPPDERRLLDAYAAGVNSHIQQLRDLPPEYKLLGVKPEPWTPLHSVLWTKSMSWLLSASASTDALYEQLVRSDGEELASWVVPDYPADGPRILPPDQMRDLRGASAAGPESESPPPTSSPSGATPKDGASLPPALPQPHEAIVMLDRLLGAGPGVGSNNWVVHGSRTATQAPLLSNDPHLGVQVPSVWYLAEVETPQQHVIGATMPGMPGVAIGHNEDIAWGLTNLGADVMDLFLERIDPQQPSAVLRPGGREELTVVEHEIIVRGRARPVHLTVRRSSNGPLVTEFFPGFGDEVALRWTALEDGDRTLSAFLAIGRASNWDEFLSALRLFAVPSQNFIYADRAGHIGWKAPGLIPVRRGFSGKGFARGWLNEGWSGFIPFDELPVAFDPVQGWIASANNHPVPPDYPHNLGTRFSQPYRAMRIVDLLEQGAGRTAAGHRAMQQDILSAQVDELLPLLLQVSPRGEIERRGMELLRDWEGHHGVDSGAAALYNAWMVEAAALLTKGRFGRGRASRVRGLSGTFLRSALTGPAQALCIREKARGQPALADCSALAQLAFTRATARLKRSMGADVGSWTWGRIHRIHYHHRLALLPHLKGQLDTIRPSPGGPHTINIGSYSAARPFTQNWFPSYRQVIDLSDWKKSGWIHSPGQSGVPWRAHYRDLVDPYLAGELLPMAFGAAAVAPFVARTRQIRR
jgi:penicillin amidase